MHKVLLIFVDGLGIGDDDPTTNPVNESVCPHLLAAFGEHAKPIDARLGVPGTPQSATGQTSLLTGINAQETLGRHVEGFPGPQLQEIIRESSIFEKLNQRGLTSTFANGYLAHSVEDVHAMRHKSVTTVATLAAFGDVRRRHILEQREAVSHDVTRETGASRGYTGELISPEEGAKDLMGIAAAHHFTLFEFFQTDHAGHSGDRDQAEGVLKKLDRFLKTVLLEAKQSGILVILT
ncbi:MAG: metalloenzyme, partial [Verrucomicrobia bacterium]|nr:metalloenzyme [Verrucomicrobiota bacterium]